MNTKSRRATTSRTNQRRKMVVDYIRWVMVRKNDPKAPAPETVVPELPEAVGLSELVVPYNLHVERYGTALAGSPHLWEDYRVGERIDHIDGMTIEEAEHMMATRMYQNTARVHFNQHVEKDGRFGRRIIYGGHIISLARSLSFNGLAKDAEGKYDSSVVLDFDYTVLMPRRAKFSIRRNLLSDLRHSEIISDAVREDTCV